MYLLEICANSVESAIAAEKGGAQRIELCTNLNEGGTTPSYGQIKWCVENLNLEVWPLIRPRGGDFLYTEAEFECILDDIKFCKKVGCNGIVTGLLDIDGSVDSERCAQIIAEAAPMPVAFHRAFDMSNDLFKALAEIIKLGFVRILTSGGKANAQLGANQIAKLIAQSQGCVEVMPGAGINLDNIASIARITGAKSFHTTAKSLVNSSMQFKNELGKMSNYNADEFKIEQTNKTKVKQLIDILNKL